ncbi:MASE1 domain-containing protein [Stenotrophomonas sp. GZD-301]|uniref:MASE1 domain-containing protein n=1 Tax=Stenotrophomonas sp. GZD-301 TaxID=3404814 RepID=UPI003BB6A154
MHCAYRVEQTPPGLALDQRQSDRNDTEEWMRMERWKDARQLSFRIYPYGLAIALIYALAYWAAREASVDQFFLPAGIRIAALLICPYRYWLYLLFGEYCYFAYARYPMVEKYGMEWVVLGSALLMPAVMLIVHLHRKLMSSETDIWLISVAAASTAAVTSLNLGLSHVLWSTPPVTALDAKLTRFLVGDFIGILTIAPLALLWSKRHTDSAVTKGHVLPTSACLILMIMLGVLAHLIPADSPATKTDLLLLMALPAVALTCMHGWRGAAISVPLWSLIVRLTMPSTGVAESFDPAAFSVQQNLAVVGIALLAVGSCLSYYYRRYRSTDQDGRNAISLARNTHIAAEMDLRTRALDIRKLGDGLEHSLDDLSDWLDAQGHQDLASSLRRVSAVHSRKFREQVTMVYPTSLEHVGLYLALQTGGIHEAWKDTDRLMLHRLGGDPCQLSIGLQLATYRTIAEAVSLLLQHEPGQIHISARCGRFRRDRGILVAVALLDTRRHLSDGTMTLALERLTGRTLAYGGTVQCRRNRIRILLLEPRPDAETAQHFRFPVHCAATHTR